MQPRHSRAHQVAAEGKPSTKGSSDPSFRSGAARWNPEELLLASLSACHKLWYLGLCAQAGIVVTCHVDDAEGFMTGEANGAGQFTSAILHAGVTVAPGADTNAALTLHHEAHAMCFIARLVNFAVEHRPVIVLIAFSQSDDFRQYSQVARHD